MSINPLSVPVDPPTFSDGDPSKRPKTTSYKLVENCHKWFNKLGAALSEDGDEKGMDIKKNFDLFSQSNHQFLYIHV